MTKIAISHPAADQLAAFANGRLDDDQWAEIQCHLAESERCTAIAAAVRDDSFCHRVRQCATPGVSPDAVGQTSSWSVPQEAIAAAADSSNASGLRDQPEIWFGFAR